MEFWKDLKSNIVIQPKGKINKLRIPDFCSSNSIEQDWTSKYDIAMVDVFNQPTYTDGINNEGLSVSVLLLSGFTKYEQVTLENCSGRKKAVSMLQSVEWILGKYEEMDFLISYRIIFTLKLLSSRLKV